MASQNVEYLRENGPTKLRDIPQRKIDPEDRMGGVWTFTPTSGIGRCGGTFKQMHGVAYIDSIHSLEDVISEHIRSNRSVIEKMEETSKSEGGLRHNRVYRMYKRYDDEFGEAFLSVRSEFDL